MNWHKLKFKNFITLQRGFDLPVTQMKDGEIPVLGSTGIVGYHNKAKSNPPGVVTGRSGTIGIIQYTDKPYWPHNTSLWVKDFKSNHPKFVYYKMQTLNLNRFNGGASVPTLNRNNLDNLIVLIPDTSIQEKIANILSTYDDLIDTNRRRIQLLEESARLLFREWFVYFRFPGHEKVKIVDGVPEGWKKGSVQDISKVKSGYAFNSKDWLDEGNPVIKIGNIIGDGTVNLDNCSYINHNVASKTKDFVLKKGDLLIAMTGATVGKVGLLSENSKTAYLNQRVGKFIPKFEGAELILYCFFMSNTAQNHITNYAAGAAQPNISAYQIESIKIIVAAGNIYTQFIKLVEPMFKEILNLRNQNQKLAQARDLLLPRLMSGAIEV